VIFFNESFTSPNDVESNESLSNANISLIISNIPLTLIKTIQALVLYDRDDTSNEGTIGLAIELYNSTQDANLTEVLATTAEITTADNIYRFDFPADLPKYLFGYPTTDTATQIISQTASTKEDVSVSTNPTLIKGGLNLTGDLVISEDVKITGNTSITGDLVVSGNEVLNILLEMEI
jgi:hypothetical protein